jgi:hypothetical protein
MLRELNRGDVSTSLNMTATSKKIGGGGAATSPPLLLPSTPQAQSCRAERSEVETSPVTVTTSTGGLKPITFPGSFCPSVKTDGNIRCPFFKLMTLGLEVWDIYFIFAVHYFLTGFFYATQV